MADFKLSAEIEMQASQALREIDKIKKATKSTEREFNLLGKSVTLDTQRIAAGLKKITAISGVMFGAMAMASPSMRAAFKQMELSAFVLSLELGEHLAPMIEATLVPAMEWLTDTVLSLDDDKQTLIATTIALTFFLGILAIAIAAVTWEFVLVALIVVAVALAIAGLIVYWDEITEAIGDFISKIPGIENFMESIVDLKDAVLRFWDVAKPIFKLIALAFLISMIPAVAGLTVYFSIMIATIMLIIPAITLVMDIFTALLNFVSGIIEAIVLLLHGDFGGALDKLGETFLQFFIDILDAVGKFANQVKDVLNSIFDGIGELVTGTFSGVFNTLIDFFNDFVVKNINKALAILDDLPVVSVSWRMDEIEHMQEGGTVERTGLIFAHRKEEVLRPVEARQFRQQRTGTGGGNTFVFNNTFKIGSVNNRSQMLAYARETASMQKREMDRRFHA